MVGQDEAAAIMYKCGHTAGIVFYIPKMRVIQSQESASQYFSNYTMSDNGDSAFFIIIHNPA